jgi:hypothetical protein
VSGHRRGYVSPHVTGSFEAMMSGGDINPIKTRGIGPESVGYAEGFLDKFDKNFIDRESGLRGSGKRTDKEKLTNCEGGHN